MMASLALLLIMQFAQENEQLFEHVSTMVDEVRQIEGKVIEISKLQELFSQKVLEQVNNYFSRLIMSSKVICAYNDHYSIVHMQRGYNELCSSVYLFLCLSVCLSVCLPVE